MYENKQMLRDRVRDLEERVNEVYLDHGARIAELERAKAQPPGADPYPLKVDMGKLIVTVRDYLESCVNIRNEKDASKMFANRESLIDLMNQIEAEHLGGKAAL